MDPTGALPGDHGDPLSFPGPHARTPRSVQSSFGRAGGGGVAPGARAVLRRARVCVCVCVGRLGRDLNIYELCSTRTRRVYLALCSSPLPWHTLTLTLTRAHAPWPARLPGSGRAAGWPAPPPRPARRPDEAAATGKPHCPAAVCACGTRPRNLGRTEPPSSPHPGFSLLLGVSAERRPQEAAPRKAASDRSARRQTSKRAACVPLTPQTRTREGSPGTLAEP